MGTRLGKGDRMETRMGSLCLNSCYYVCTIWMFTLPSAPPVFVCPPSLCLHLLSIYFSLFLSLSLSLSLSIVTHTIAGRAQPAQRQENPLDPDTMPYLRTRGTDRTGKLGQYLGKRDCHGGYESYELTVRKIKNR